MNKTTLKLNADESHDCYMFVYGMTKAKASYGVHRAYLLGAMERFWNNVVAMDKKKYIKRYPFMPKLLKEHEQEMDKLFPIRAILK